MVISERTRFWLKVVLTATFPVWVVPAAVVAAVSVVFMMAWECISDMVDPAGKRSA